MVSEFSCDLVKEDATLKETKNTFWKTDCWWKQQTTSRLLS